MIVNFPTHINLHEGEYISLESAILDIPPRTFIHIDYPLERTFTAVVVTATEWTLPEILGAFDASYRKIYDEEDYNEQNSSVVEIGCVSCKITSLNFYEYMYKFVREDRETCCICMSSRLSSKIVINCGHKYHYLCLKRWFRNSNKCPLCNDPIKPCDTCKSKRYIEIRFSVNSIRRSQDMERTPTEGTHGIGPVYYEDLRFAALSYDAQTNVLRLLRPEEPAPESE